jgi:hypothetical protein
MGKEASHITLQSPEADEANYIKKEAFFNSS